MSTATLDATDVLRAIAAGTVDDRFDAVFDAIKERRRTVARIETADIAVGDIVTLNDDARPQYLRGLRAEVTGLNKATIDAIIVEEDKPRARRFGRGQCRFYRSQVDA